MDAKRIRFIVVDVLGGFETMEREDATYHAMLGLSDILLHVAEDPIAVALVGRVESLIDRECGIRRTNGVKLGDRKVSPLISL